MSENWLRHAVVYQIYTRSFYDTNGDGLGDFQGVIEKLDYLKTLGVDALWLSPFCDSPNDDNGYDVSDYRAVMDEFGTLADLEELIVKAHEKGLKILMDFVVNHSSDRNPWFLASRSSRNGPQRDWYYWADGKKGKDGKESPPNNWDSYFGGPAWTRDETTGQWYLHHFLKSQPDLNWENPEVRREMQAIAAWWLDKGVDGFRLDAVHHIGKPEGLPDAPGDPAMGGLRHFKNTPRTHSYLRKLRSEVWQPRKAVAVGETGGTTPRSARLYVAPRRGELDLIFHFGHFYLEQPRASDFRRYFLKWHRILSRVGAWDAVFFSNHDFARHLSLFGDDTYLRRHSAQFFAGIILSGWGTPFLYQGEELGMANAGFEDLNSWKDEASMRHYREALARGEDPELALGLLRSRGRDNARTPMPWNDSKNAGFTSGTPWIAPAPDYLQVNVAKQIDDLDSVFGFYRRMIALRKEQPVLRKGTLKPLGPDHRQIYAVRRELDGQVMAIVGNWSRDFANWRLPQPGGTRKGWKVVLANYPRALDQPVARMQRLRPWEFLLLTAV